MRDMIPGCSVPLLLVERAEDVLRVDGAFFEVAVERDELRGDFAAAVLAVLDAVLFDAFVRPGLAVREVPLLLFPLAAVFDRADVVLLDEDDLELPLFDEPLLDPPLFEAPLLREEPLLDLPLLLRDEPALLLRDELPPDELRLLPDEALRELLPLRLDELLLRPPLELFLVDELRDEPPDDRELEDFLAPPLEEREVEDFLAPLLEERELEAFFAPPLEERELEAFFAAPLDERELEDFLAPPLDERELEPNDFFLAPPDEDRDDDELFFEPPLLLELDDEREPLDFLVVAMQIIPPVIFGMILHDQHSAIRVPFIVLYEVETAVRSVV